VRGLTPCAKPISPSQTCYRRQFQKHLPDARCLPFHSLSCRALHKPQLSNMVQLKPAALAATVRGKCATGEQKQAIGLVCISVLLPSLLVGGLAARWSNETDERQVRLLKQGSVRGEQCHMRFAKSATTDTSLRPQSDARVIRSIKSRSRYRFDGGSQMVRRYLEASPRARRDLRQPWRAFDPRM
jgi:hypothetical protein